MRRGWRYVLGAFFGIGGGFASLYFYTAGLFIKPMAAEFGWTRTEASLGALSFTIGNIIGVPVVGRMVDRYGERPVVFGSGLLLALSFLALAQFTRGLTSFLVLVFLLTLLSAGSNAVGYNRIIVRYFVERRGLALGLALTGMAVGAAILPRPLAALIAGLGWRPAYYALAGLAAVMSMIAAVLIKEERCARPQRPIGPPRPLGEICRHSAFLSISAIIFLAATAVLGTTLHLVAMLTDAHMPPTQAGAIATGLGVAVLVGRIGAGDLLNRWDAGFATFFLLILAAVGALLLSTGAPGLALPGAILIGFGVGTEGDILAYLLGRRFPVRDFGSVYGTIFAVHALGGGAGGLFAGILRDATGDYRLWLLTAAVALGLAALIALATERGIKPSMDMMRP